MSTLGGFAKPGQAAAIVTTEREIFAQGFEANRAVFDSSLILGTTRDAGNTPTTLLRPGLLLGQVTASSGLLQWDSTATDGSQNFFSILWKDLRAQDFDANNVDRHFSTVLGLGVMKASQLLIKGVALVGHADEYLARRSLAAAGFYLDDDMNRAKAGLLPRTVAKTADYTVLPGDNGTLFTTQGAAGAVNFTLPSIKKGLEYSFFVEADQTLTLTSVVTDTLVVFNDLAADTIAFSTASEKIGGMFKIRCNADASKWLVEVDLGIETQTPVIAT